MVSQAPPPPRRPQPRGLETRRALLEAALREFASVGFDAASTRVIAARAGVRQGQLTYQFPTKDELWRATVDHLFERFDAEFSAALETMVAPGEGDPVAVFESSVRALVRAVSKLPELNRVMVHEATDDSDRLRWIVDTHVRQRFDQAGMLWSQVRARGATHLEAEPVLMYYCLLGAASLMYVNAPEARLLMGSDQASVATTDALVDAHADVLVAMVLGPREAPTVRVEAGS